MSAIAEAHHTNTSIDRAIEAAGSANALAKQIGVKPAMINHWRTTARSVLPDACPVIESATGVKCEDLRPDLRWIRDDDSIVGYLGAVVSRGDTDRKECLDYVAQWIRNQGRANCSKELIGGRWAADAYVAGMMHGVDQAQAEELLREHYSQRPWDEGMLEDLANDAEDARDKISAWTFCLGMMHGLSQPDQDRLIDKYKPRGWDGWSTEKTNALWAEIQGIRAQRNEVTSGAAKNTLHESNQGPAHGDDLQQRSA